MRRRGKTHKKGLGYIFWLFGGIMGAHRFYYGRPITGVIWLFTLGLLGVGWLVDLFLIPRMNREANRRYIKGPVDYNVTWALLLILGPFGVHRFFIGKWVTGLVYLFTGGLLLLGVIYDYCTLNDQIDQINFDCRHRRGNVHR